MTRWGGHFWSERLCEGLLERIWSYRCADSDCLQVSFFFSKNFSADFFFLMSATLLSCSSASVQPSGWKSDPPAAEKKKKCLAACQAVEQVRLPSLVFSVFIVRGLGSAVFKKARQHASWSVCSGNFCWRKYWSPNWRGREVEILCKDLPCSCRRQLLGKKGAFILNCAFKEFLRGAQRKACN